MQVLGQARSNLNIKIVPVRIVCVKRPTEKARALGLRTNWLHLQ